MKSSGYLAMLLVLFTIPIIFLMCIEEEIAPKFTFIEVDGSVLVSPTCIDTISTLFIRGPEHTFDSVDVAYIWNFDTDTPSDTFFLASELLTDAFLSLSAALSLPDTSVCMGTIFNALTDELSIAGHIGAESYNSNMGIAVETFDHSGVWVLVIFSYEP